MGKLLQTFVFILIYSINSFSQVHQEIEFSGRIWSISNPLILGSKLDSSSLIDIILKESERSPNNTISSSSEVFNMIEGNYKYEMPKIKVQCKKYYYCKENFGIESFESINIFRQYSDEETKKLESEVDYLKDLTVFIYASLITGENNVHYKHTCKKCANWSDAYRKKEGCNVCFDEKSTYCGAKVICPLCDGSGYKWEDQDPLELGFNEYLKKLKIKSSKFILYFNSPSDFGVIDCQDKIKINYSENKNGRELIDFMFISKKDENKIRQEVFNFKSQKEKKLQIDKELLLNIEKNIVENNPVKAANDFQKLNFPSEKIRSIIEFKLIEYYKDSIYEVDLNIAKDFIKNNSNALIRSNLKNVDVFIDSKANVLATPNVNLINSNIKVKQLNISNFIIPVNQKITFEIIESIELVSNSDIIVSNTKSFLIKKSNGKIYESSLLGTSWFNEFHTVLSHLNSNEIHLKFTEISEVPKKNHYLIVSKRVKTFHAIIVPKSRTNNVVYLGEKEEAFVSSENKFSKRIVKKTFRLTTWLVALPWTLLRSYEYLKTIYL